MANRIKDFSTTASVTASDDFFAIDGATNNSRRLSAYAPVFGGDVIAQNATAMKLTAANGVGGVVGYSDAGSTAFWKALASGSGATLDFGTVVNKPVNVLVNNIAYAALTSTSLTIGNASSTAAFSLEQYGNASSAAAGGRWNGYKSRSGGVITTADQITAIYGYGHDGTGFIEAGAILLRSSGTVATNRVAAQWEFYVHPDSTTGDTLAATITSDGAFNLVCGAGTMMNFTPSSGNLAAYQRWNTSGGTYYFGVESSAGNVIINGAPAYAMSMSSATGRDLILGIDAGNRVVTLGTSQAKTAWTTTGGRFALAARTYTDSSTAGSGTSATAVFDSHAAPTLAASNASVTTTDAAVVYISGNVVAGANMTITNSWALWANGNVKMNGTLAFANGTPRVSTNDGALLLEHASGNDNGTLYIAPSGTATTAKVQLYGAVSSSSNYVRHEFSQIGSNTLFLQQSVGTGTLGTMDFQFNGTSVLNMTAVGVVTAKSTGTGTNTEQLTLVVAGDTSATPVAGYAVAQRFYRKGNDGSTPAAAARIQSTAISGTGAAQYDSTLDFAVRNGGAMTNVLVLGIAVATFSCAVALQGTVASAGDLRLRNNAGQIVARNAAGTGDIEAIRVDSSDYVNIAAGGANVKITGNIGFNGGSAIAKPTVTGSRGANAALASLLTALANYNLITDSSS